MAPLPSFKKGDRITVVVHRHNPACSEESYNIGEHGVVVEESQEKSSIVTVRLDGHNGTGRERPPEGNYYRVENVMPMITTPVRQRLVHASILHIQKYPEFVYGDYAVVKTPRAMLKLLGPGEELGGHFIGGIVKVIEPKEGSDEVGPSGYQVQAYKLSGREYGKAPLRPWLKVGPRLRVEASAVVCRVNLEHGKYLRDLSYLEIQKLGLEEDLGFLDTPLKALPPPPKLPAKQETALFESEEKAALALRSSADASKDLAEMMRQS
eukprot:TRINITY_DN40414_c0_g1_i1.p1 TRINITY_DN40414_c0_g1~~TRINITY_DN40414_c0_g1_i1.p1  ORF type:complete len:266 (-),score=45.62 TRINITY_DN40414_c0_g1_i1:504-1301(-)